MTGAERPHSSLEERGEPVVWLAGSAIRVVAGVELPPRGIAAAFRLFGARSAASQVLLLGRTVCSPSPAMRRLRRRAVRALDDYRAILRQAPHLHQLMKLDFTILLGLYRDAVGVSRDQALEAGLVETYCHLSALVDAYDDLLDTREARAGSLTRDDFMAGRTGQLRCCLVSWFEQLSARRPRASVLVRDLEAFESRALEAHQNLDIGTGLEAPIEAVVRARAATSGLLLRFAAHLWSVLLDLPLPLAKRSEDAAATFGLVAQFADDVVDWTCDDGIAQNLLGAALRAHPDELRSARAAAERRPGWSLSTKTLQRVAPRSLAMLAAVRRRAAVYPPDCRFDGLRQFGDDVYLTLLPALPSLNFDEFDDIRAEVQEVLATW